MTLPSGHGSYHSKRTTKSIFRCEPAGDLAQPFASNALAQSASHEQRLKKIRSADRSRNISRSVRWCGVRVDLFSAWREGP